MAKKYSTECICDRCGKITNEFNFHRMSIERRFMNPLSFEHNIEVEICDSCLARLEQWCSNGKR